VTGGVHNDFSGPAHTVFQVGELRFGDEAPSPRRFAAPALPTDR
jgi:hypothetical protein